MYVRLPRGLKNSTAEFQRVLNPLLGRREGRDVWEFMDDISMELKPRRHTCSA